MNDAMIVICYFACPTVVDYVVVTIGYGSREFPGDTLAETGNDDQGMTTEQTRPGCE